jgi:hypothetical protein
MSQPWEPFWLDDASTWAVEFRIQGRRIRKRLGLRDRSLRKKAWRVAKRLYDEAWEEALTPCGTPRGTPFFEAVELYIKQGGEARFLPKIMAHFGPDVVVQEIDEIMIARAADALYPDVHPDTVRRQLRVPIRAVLNFASGNRRQPSSDVRRVTWLTPEQAERLIWFAAHPEEAGLRDPRRETLRKIAFMLGVGAGPGETMALTAEGWNPATREWWLPGQKTVYRPRYIWLPERTVSLVGPVPEEGPAFPAPNGQPYVMRRNGGG